MNTFDAMQRMEPVEGPAVWALCRQGELRHVGGPNTAPPPMVAQILHTVNSSLNAVLKIDSQEDAEAARCWPSWIRNVCIRTDNPVALKGLVGLRSIRFCVVVPLAQGT